MLPKSSESFVDLFKALHEAQKVMVPAGRVADGKLSFGSGAKEYFYADYAEVVSKLQKPLASNGLAFFHQTYREPIENIHYLNVVTYLIHITGQWISTTASYRIPVNVTEKGVEWEDPMRIGSLMTYGKRYNLCNLTGLPVAGEDTDTQDVVQDGETGKLATPAKPKKADHEEPASDQQRKKLWAMGMGDYVDKKLMTKDEFVKFMGKMLDTYGSMQSPIDPGTRVFTKAGASALIKDFKDQVESYIKSLDDIPH